LSESPPAAVALNPATPPDLNALIGELLAKDPNVRPQTMQDVAARLSAFGFASIVAPVRDAGFTRLLLTPAAAPGSGETKLLPETPSPASQPPSVTATTGPRSETTLSRVAAESLRETKPVRRRIVASAIGALAVAVAVVAISSSKRAGRSEPEREPGGRAATVSVAPPRTSSAVPGAPAPPPAPPQVTVRATNAPGGLSATIDGVAALLPARLPRDGRNHVLLLRAAVYEDKTVSITGTQDASIDAAMTPLAKPAAEPAAEKKRRPRRQSIDYGTTDL
jgi:hypothetical protein